MTPHKDWYNDGIEDGEVLFRLDPVEDIQIQLFRTVDGNKQPTDECRLFIEHDVRLSRTSGKDEDDQRVRYAGQGFPLDYETAEALLAKGNREVALCLAAQIATVKALPNQPEYL